MGSLRFVNDHDVPYLNGVRVTDIKTQLEKRADAVAGDPTAVVISWSLTATDIVWLDETRTCADVFTYQVWNMVEFTMDDERPEDGRWETAYHSTPADRDQ